jgi:DNA-3-methyladenine glycosylase II
MTGARHACRALGPHALASDGGFVPAYWAEACEHLVQRDRVMARLIPQFPGACLQSRGDAFTTLVRSVVGQQISVKAAQAVWERLLGRLGVCTPQALLDCPLPDLRVLGLSARKIEYLLDLARHFADGRLDPAAWHAMDDETIIRELVAIRGIGRWTAEMFLIFYLLRPNVLPLDDVGLLRGISQCYFSGEPVSRSEAREVAAAWAPYRSVATWYIWRSLDPIPVAY